MNELARALITLQIVLLAIPATAKSRSMDLESWLSRDLVPFVRQQLDEHPRFRGESLRFAVLDNGNPQATGNALALRIRDLIRDAAANIPDVKIAWQAGHSLNSGNAGPGAPDCTKSEAHYLIGVESTLADSGAVTIEVRALDLEDRTVVAGFNRRWQGRVNASQYRELRRIETDSTLRGEREAPYAESQADLLAAHLAHDIGCQLLRQTVAEYVMTEAGIAAPGQSAPDVLELVSNNLAQFASLQFSASGDGANAVIEAKAHRIDNDLYQYWVTVRAQDPDADLAALTASAYVRLPERFAMAESWSPSAPVLEDTAEILDAMKIVEISNPSACSTGRWRNSVSSYRRYGTDDGDCFALQIRTDGDAVVFFLHHQLNHGLVRLSDAACQHRTTARIARSGENLQYPLPRDSLPGPAWSAGEGWSLAPDLDTFYALAATDTQAARALSKHIESLPKRCSASVRPGLDGIELRQWLDELRLIIGHWGPAIDWQTIRVKNVY